VTRRCSPIWPRHKNPALAEALQGRFTEHHAFMVSQYLAQLDTQQATIEALTARIETVIGPFVQARDLLVTIPGISRSVAEVIIAETGADMTVFPTAAHLASWAGVCPGMNESAGKVKSAHTRHGNAHLKGALGVAAMSASRSKNLPGGPLPSDRGAARTGPGCRRDRTDDPHRGLEHAHSPRHLCRSWE
jgi:transposase